MIVNVLANMAIILWIFILFGAGDIVLRKDEIQSTTVTSLLAYKRQRVFA